MKNKIVIASHKSPSNKEGAEIVWKNLEAQGLKFQNISLEDSDLPEMLSKIPDSFHLKEFFSSKWIIKKALRKKPDILIYDKILGWPKIKTPSKTKKVCYNHGSYTLAGLEFKRKNIIVYFFYKYILGYFEKKSYKNANKIIAVSESVKEELVEYFGISKNKIAVINNGVDLKKFKPLKNKELLKKRYGLPNNKKIIFFPGRSSFGKGFDIVKKVAKRLGKEYLVFSLGENSEKNIVKTIKKIPNEKMPEIYNCADICIFPSRYEGNSLSVLESAACGTPLILSKVGLMKTEEKMEEFTAKSVEEYVEKIKNINLKKASKKWLNFSRKFSSKKQSEKMEEILWKKK